MEIVFLSSNKSKIAEVQAILNKEEITVVPSSIKIEEIQSEDVKHLVRDKVLKAFSRIGRPIFVEHTGLYIEALNGLPGGLTQIFWDNLDAEGFIRLVAHAPDSKVIARTVIGYCDGLKIHFFEGDTKGTISTSSKGPTDFQWDCIFIPDGFSQTFAELGEKKNEISMRKKALEQLSNFLDK
ncbi:non-canonical purine NTP pyrophosphatase [Pseudomonas chlororaphis subsp. aureofaciens]|uniref:non-canonical purine NTP pyrophosphatase n=1 Tax=Pseudomonas chlororaphis TaxID=587753 RepID=UPI0009B92E57|nr:non-canonical purine NTP pyrophosphatase [Pseudomonas chlororaphis]